MTIGQRIKSMRKEQGLSIDDLAEKLGKNRTTVYRYENGDIENLPLGILDSLAEALNTTPAYLLGWKSNNDRNERKSTKSPNETCRFQWLDEIIASKLNEEECKKVMEYAKFLLSMRSTRK